MDDEEDFFIEERYFNVEEKLQCKSFANCQRNCLKEIDGNDLTFEYFQRNGFQTPMLVKENKNNGKEYFIDIYSKIPLINQFKIYSFRNENTIGYIYS